MRLKNNNFKLKYAYFRVCELNVCGIFSNKRLHNFQPFIFVSVDEIIVHTISGNSCKN